MRKPTFGVTALAVTILSVITVLRVAYEPLLPASPTEYLVSVPSSDPQSAPIVEIGWTKDIQTGLTEARRKKVGILIMFIDPSNVYAKQMELKVFRNPEMARFVSRSFVPIKINLDQYPEWRQAIQPLQRLKQVVEPGIELVVADQDGTLIDHYVVDNPFQYYGPEAILPFLIQAKSYIRQGAEFLQSAKCLQNIQDLDIQTLINAKAEPIPAFDEFAASLITNLKLNQPGFLNQGSTKVSPMAFRLLAKLGLAPFAASTLKQIALTPLYDPIDSGFFREARVSPNSTYIDTAKSSSHNALIGLVTAQLACATNDSELKQLAIDIGNEVISDYSDGDSISTSRMNDQSVDTRSKRSSLTEKKLNSLLTSDQKKVLMSFVSKSQSQDQDLVSLKSLSSLSKREFVTIRQTLREKLGSAPGLSESEHIAIQGYLGARLLDLYRYTDDQRFLTKGTELSNEAYSAIANQSVAKIYGNREIGPGWLGSYLAVADCGLSEYAATGVIYPLRHGEEALNLAIEKFREPRTGLLNNVPVDLKRVGSLTPSVPDLADDGRESMNSLAIRLAFHYSVTTEKEASRTKFLAFAQSMIVRLNSVSRNGNVKTAGYYDAAYDVGKNFSVVVSGPNRSALSNLLAKKLPFNLVYPLTVVNPPKTDLIYVRRGETFEGPYSVLEIEKKVSGSNGL